MKWQKGMTAKKKKYEHDPPCSSFKNIMKQV